VRAAAWGCIRACTSRVGSSEARLGSSSPTCPTQPRPLPRCCCTTPSKTLPLPFTFTLTRTPTLTLALALTLNPNQVLHDHAAGELQAGRHSGGGQAAVSPLLAAQPQPSVDFAGWLRLDAEERRRGADKGKVRDKLTDVDEMLRVASG